MSIDQSKLACLGRLGLDSTRLASGKLLVTSPIDGSTLGHVEQHTAEEVDTLVSNSVTAFNTWRTVPAPKRGELIRIFGEKLRHYKDDLGQLVTLECGKILQEGLGEVQEMIDICDFAVGLSRQLYGLTIVSERPEHKMLENWHPLGPVGVISAFNFPVAVWAWNTALAVVCGDTVIWKPSEKTPLTALACEVIFAEAVAEFGEAPANLVQILIGDAKAGEQLVEDNRVPVISATGSCAMGKSVAPKVAARLGRTILELGGNNAITVCPTANLDMAVTGIVFGAVGTAGQRCTTTRRLFTHESIYDELTSRLRNAYQRVTIANPLDPDTLVGPLIDKTAFDLMQEALGKARAIGAIVHGGERSEVAGCAGGYYVQPALVEMPDSVSNIQEETFAPILYLFKYSETGDAIRANNDVRQGLSSSIFTNDVREAELFTSATGSDCGIANVNIGTSGAEIGGAFGGEKETGGGRESGSDAWKGYMRRSTCTINYSSELPLAQGVQFDL
jgi:L-aminoadipate-semialdehyde dehydrogenase